MRNSIMAICEEEPFGCSLAMAKELARIVETLHQEMEVRTVSSDFLVESQIKGNRQIAIEGIERAVRECFDQGKLFSELNLPWTSSKAVRGAATLVHG